MDRKMIERGFPGTREPAETAREIEGKMIARKAAAEGMVLLKNEGLLPLAENCSVAVYGIGASRTVKGGIGSGDVNERSRVSIYEGLKSAGLRVTNEAWIRQMELAYREARESWRDKVLDLSKGGDLFGFFHAYSTNPFRMPSGPDLVPERDLTEDRGTAIYVLSRICGEGSDRYETEGDYYLTEEEHRIVEAICRSYRDVVLVLNTGGQVDLSILDEFANIRSVLQIAQPGMEAGHAFADILLGRVNPSGKLTDSFAWKYADYPNAENFSHNNGDVWHEDYREGIYVGYRYFDSYEKTVRYGFGFGLSYTTFAIGKAEIAWRGRDRKTFCVSADVTNTGERPGREVLQVYVSLPVGRLEKEYRRLAGFAKTRLLERGETERVEVEIPVSALASFDDQAASWILEGGSYGIWVGNSLKDAGLCGLVVAEDELVLERDRHICPLTEPLEEFHRSRELAKRQYQTWLAAADGLPSLWLSAGDVETRVVTYRENCEIVDPAARAFVDELTEEQLIALSAGDPGKAQGSSNLGSAGISVPGSAAQTSTCALDRNLASMVLADGPAGLRLMPFYFVREGEIVPMPFEFSLEGGFFLPDADQTEGDRYYQYCTAVPTGTGLAQTWDLDLIAEVGEMIGRELLYFGITLWLAPGMNIHRNPLCGRNFEYYSEDPLLSGEVAAAMTLGVQRNPGVGTTVKHFACNNQEDNRMESDSLVSERALREIYLRGFEIAVRKSQPMSLMTSYNLINGVHAANSVDLVTDVLRNEWGFEGAVMTDWTTTMQDHDPKGATASGCMRAGNDMIMPGAPSDFDNIRRELAEGSLSIEDLKACVSRTVELIWQSNQYEGALPYRKV